MEFIQVIQVVRRWWLAAIGVVLVTLIVLGLRLYFSPPAYETKVKVQITAPQQDEVALFDRYRSSTLRDDMIVARNNFVEVIQSREVRVRTVQALALTEANALYRLDIQPLRDSDFIYITVQASSARLAETIANTHATAAVEYYGEMRAKPAAAVRTFIEQQLVNAQTELDTTQQEFTNFKKEHGITTLNNQYSILRDGLEQLQQERNRRLIEGPTSWEIKMLERRIETLQVEREKAFAQGADPLVRRFDDTINRDQEKLQEIEEQLGATDHIDRIISARQQELQQVIEYEPQYINLEQRVDQARSKYELLQGKLNEAILKENNIKITSYIQIVEPAVAPVIPLDSNIRLMLGLGLLGSLGAGIVLAFLMEYLTGWQTMTSLSPLRRRPTIARRYRRRGQAAGDSGLNGIHDMVVDE